MNCPGSCVRATCWCSTILASCRHLAGPRAGTGGRWEGLFCHTTPDGLWELLSQTRGRLSANEIILIEPGSLSLTLVRRTPEGRWLVRPQPGGPGMDLLQRYGQVPLPPYIRKGKAEAADQERYQTVYARQAGSVAAPTAGLHFTPGLDQLAQHRIEPALFCDLARRPGDLCSDSGRGRDEAPHAPGMGSAVRFHGRRSPPPAGNEAAESWPWARPRSARSWKPRRRPDRSSPGRERRSCSSTRATLFGSSMPW